MCLSLWSPKWLSLSRSLASNFNPLVFMDIISKVWFWSNRSQYLLIMAIKEEFRIFISKLFHYNCRTKGIFEKKYISSWNLGYCCFKTSCSVAVISGNNWKRFEWEFHEKLCKVNIIFLTNLSILRMLSLILEEAYLLQLSLWLRYIGKIQDFCEMIH